MTVVTLWKAQQGGFFAHHSFVLQIVLRQRRTQAGSQWFCWVSAVGFTCGAYAYWVLGWLQKGDMYVQLPTCS